MVLNINDSYIVWVLLHCLKDTVLQIWTNEPDFAFFLYQVPVFRIQCLIQDILVHKWTWSSMFIGWDLFFCVAYKWISMKILCSLCYDKEKNSFTFLIRKQLEGIGLVRSYLDLHWHIVKKMTVIKGLQVGFLNR